MEDEIIQTIQDLAGLMGCPEMIAIIYNPYREGMEPKDCTFLKSLMENNVYKFAAARKLVSLVTR